MEESGSEPLTNVGLQVVVACTVVSVRAPGQGVLPKHLPSPESTSPLFQAASLVLSNLVPCSQQDLITTASKSMHLETPEHVGIVVLQDREGCQALGEKE